MSARNAWPGTERYVNMPNSRVPADGGGPPAAAERIAV